jgi:hypothetical protein
MPASEARPVPQRALPSISTLAAQVEVRAVLVVAARSQHVVGARERIFAAPVSRTGSRRRGCLDYLRQLLPRLRPGGLVVAHNMNDHQADPAFVKAITSDPGLETVFVNKGPNGVGLTLKKR